MVKTPLVAIVTINYQGREDTLECLQSVGGLTYSNFFVVLVCQPPDDGTASAVRSLRLPWVRIVENAENNGFAGGSNTGINVGLEADADVVFLLNNDTTVEPDLLQKLLEELKPDDVGVVGPKVMYFDEPTRIWATGGEINRFGHAWTVRMNELDDTDVGSSDRQVAPVTIVIGCGLMVKRSVLEAVGLMDERFFLYYEESDLCKRISRNGYKILSVGSARMWHKVSRSTGTDSNLTAYYMLRNRLLFVRKNADRKHLILSLLDALRSLYLAWRQKLPRERQQTMARAIADFLLGRFGKSSSHLVHPKL